MTVLESLTLASASPRRLELLRSLGLDVHVVPSTYHEPPHEGFGPKQLGARHAKEKAREVASRIKNTPLIVAADTVVDVDGVAFGKPCDHVDADRMLRVLSGREHVVHTAFTAIVPQTGQEFSDVESTRVRFYHLTPAEIDYYVSTGEPMDKAGAYGIQGLGATLVERINGDFYTVMGFPLGRFVRSLPRMGFTLYGAKQTADKS